MARSRDHTCTRSHSHTLALCCLHRLALFFCSLLTDTNNASASKPTALKLPNIERTLSDVEAAKEEASGDAFVEVELTSNNLRAAGSPNPSTGSALDDLLTFSSSTSNVDGAVSIGLGLRARSRSNSIDSEADIRSVSSKDSNHSNTSSISDKKKSTPQRGVIQQKQQHSLQKLTQAEKAWMILARTDGGTGQSLIQAWCGQYDGIRAWICSVLVWLARGPKYSNPQFLSLEETATKIGNLLDPNLSRQGDTNSNAIAHSSLEFIRNALLLLSTRSKDLHVVDKHGIAVPKRFGNIIPLHCGHNGWPGKVSLQALDECIFAAGFHVGAVSPAPSLFRNLDQ